MIRMEAEMDKWEARMNEQLGKLTSLRDNIDHVMRTEDSRLELIQEVFVGCHNNLTALQSRADDQVQQLIEKINNGEFILSYQMKYCLHFIEILYTHNIHWHISLVGFFK
ncbi:hypothetical protein DPMN_173215 [Dreissena polymorpha]|uniref:Uncharacterized protein n=1 Tax=Dreissena polymorpha TaxID=45954 RepID=A0A9D4E296_DREPO|nr:hypothetical protein DPMN_173215 [Dreissena polymorpha]